MMNELVKHRNITYGKLNLMAKLSLRQRHWVLSFHIISAALWTGGVISLLLVEWYNHQTQSGDVLNALDRIINQIDEWIIIPAATGSISTATLLCWGTNYGFTKFYWTIVKWILTVALMVFGSFYLDPWGVKAEAISTSEGLKALENVVYNFNVHGILIGGAGNFVCLMAIVIISVLKPWGRRKQVNNLKQQTASDSTRQ
jgi:uncharacterized membrane protein